MKQQAKVEVHMPEDVLRQFLYLCEAEHRTPNNQIMLLLRNSIAYFERSKGRMDKARLAAVDVTPYFDKVEEKEREE